jgi:two-component system capsular synthesis response regulator RcsB
MFRKILIIEDIDSISLGITTILEKHLSADIRTTKYCDEGFLKVKKAIHENAPFDLIITDLSFKEDHRETKINSGEDLIKAVKAVQPGINIIVYSIEDRPFLIKSLFDTEDINAFVAKGRESNNELIEAITTIYHGGSYISPEFSHILKDPVFFEINDYDVHLLKLLAEGQTQEFISQSLRKRGEMRSSISSIEKRINKLKIFFKAHNTIHLVAIVKDMGII